MFGSTVPAQCSVSIKVIACSYPVLMRWMASDTGIAARYTVGVTLCYGTVFWAELFSRKK